MLGHALVAGFAVAAVAAFLPAFAVLAFFNALLPALPALDDPVSILVFFPQATLVSFGAFFSLMVYSDCAFGLVMFIAELFAAFYEKTRKSLPGFLRAPSPDIGNGK